MAALCSTNSASGIGAEYRPSNFVRSQFIFKALWMADLCDAFKSQICSNISSLNPDMVFDLSTTVSNVKYS
jgi:hypothetical protein